MCPCAVLQESDAKKRTARVRSDDAPDTKSAGPVLDWVYNTKAAPSRQSCPGDLAALLRQKQMNVACAYCEAHSTGNAVPSPLCTRNDGKTISKSVHKEHQTGCIFILIKFADNLTYSQAYSPNRGLCTMRWPGVMAKGHLIFLLRLCFQPL